jgi:hypothetical protein
MAQKVMGEMKEENGRGDYKTLKIFLVSKFFKFLL